MSENGPMAMGSVRDEYDRRLKACQKRAAHLRRLDLALSWMRFFVFVFGLIAVLASLSTHHLLIPLLAGVGLVFLLLVILHDRLAGARELTRRSQAFYELGLARLEDRWPGRGDDGARYLSEDHPYAQDLNIFGSGSLFELLCTARTRAGRDTLAHWLLEPATPEVVRERQAAVRELTPMLDLREELWQLADGTDDAASLVLLGRWAAAPRTLISTKERVCCLLLSAATLLTGGYGFYVALFDPQGLRAAPLVPGLFVLLLVVEYLFFLRLKGRVQTIIASAKRIRLGIQRHRRLFGRLEKERFSAPRLAELGTRLTGTGQPASRRLRRFERLLTLWEDGQSNQAFSPLSRILFWSTHFSWLIERWRAESAPQALAWIQGAAEIEALCALATYAHEHPGDCFPELREAGPTIACRGVAHPLLAEERSIRNDVELAPGRPMLIVSGSNMAGKSTFLRAIGVNAVLALAGSAVRARSFQLSPLALFVVMQPRDSLRQGISRFYQEILRVKAMVEQAQSGRPVLFLIDEIFNGTNSHDRLLATRAILQTMKDRRALGMITTHDLALTQLEHDLEGLAWNAHFSDEIVSGQLRFDYLLKPGVVSHSNALLLMRSIGLDV